MINQIAVHPLTNQNSCSPSNLKGQYLIMMHNKSIMKTYLWLFKFQVISFEYPSICLEISSQLSQMSEYPSIVSSTIFQNMFKLLHWYQALHVMLVSDLHQIDIHFQQFTHKSEHIRTHDILHNVFTSISNKIGFCMVYRNMMCALHSNLNTVPTIDNQHLLVKYLFI